MANNDLQALYKMRDILKREQYVKSYNQNVNQNLINAVNSTIPNYVNRKNTAYNNYQVAIDKKIKSNENFVMIKLPIIVFSIVIIVLAMLSVAFSSNITQSLIYLFCTAAWMSVLSGYLCYYVNEEYKPLIPFSILAIANVVFAIITISPTNLVESFWDWVVAIVIFLVWPISNFFLMGPVVWLSIASLVVFSIIMAFYMTKLEDFDNESNVNSSLEVQRAKAEFDKAYQEYSVAYNEQHAKIKGSYQKMMKPDTYTSDKKAMQNIIPANLQTLDMINKLIWCIEQKYAYDIVSARNWYVQQEHNAAMQAKMQAVADQVSEVKRVQEQAVADAAIAHREAMAAIEKQTDAINKQTSSVNKQLEANINAVNQAAASVSNSVDRAARSVSQSVDAAGRNVSSSIDRL